MAEKLFTIEEVLAYVCCGFSETEEKVIPQDQGEQQPLANPEDSKWNPNIGSGYNPKDYLASYYKSLLEVDGTY